MKAKLSKYRQAPRKVRLLADLIRGKSAEEAKVLLGTVSKRAALPVQKLLASAVANAGDTRNISENNLFIKEIRVDAGPTIKRFMPRAFGRATPIRKRTSHISIVLDEKFTERKPKDEEQKTTEVSPEATK